MGHRTRRFNNEKNQRIRRNQPQPRWGLGLADGERKYDDLEKRLVATPTIAVPTITMEGDSNGAIHGPSTSYRNKFSGKYDYRLITGGVGHNLPQEDPQSFAQAVIDVDGF